MNKVTELFESNTVCPNCGSPTVSKQFVFDEDIVSDKKTSSWIQEAKNVLYYSIDCGNCGHHECDVDNCPTCTKEVEVFISEQTQSKDN